jgi:LL-diaminopimelate aminotransferase
MASWRANRLDELSPYLFVEIDRRKREALAAGRDVIDFGVGDPDQPTHNFIIEAMAKALRTPSNHRYPLGIGSPAFRQAIADFFKRRFGVALDPQTEIIALIGSKEGLGHLPTAVVNPGETVLIPDPGYPVYTGGTIFAGGKCHYMALREENAWLPVLEDIPSRVRCDAKLMFLNYPNNPTAACASLSFFERAVAYAREHRILIASDAAYSEVFFDADHSPPSILQVAGAKDVAIEFHSLSKTFNMTGWRVGFAVGNPEALAALAKVKNNVDSGVFGAVQEAAIAALQNAANPTVFAQVGPDGMYARRRDILVNGLRKAGWSVASPRATFYVWARCPGGLDSMTVAQRILAEADVVAIPGIGFGPGGEGYIRYALTVDEARTRQAVERIGRISWPGA